MSNQDRTFGTSRIEVRAFSKKQDMGYSCSVCNRSTIDSSLGTRKEIDESELHVIVIGVTHLHVCTRCLTTLSGFVNKRLIDTRREGWEATGPVNERARRIAKRTEDAYSVGRYRSWVGVARTLLMMGYVEEECEAIMRSKWTRWAADEADKVSNATGKDLQRYIENHTTSKDLAELLAS